MELVTGKAGTPHVSSADDGRRIAGEVGTGSYVLQTGGRLAPSLVDANTVRFATGDMIVQGRHIGLTAPEDVKVASGTQGKKRTDYVCVHYKRDVSGANPTLVETVEWAVLQGTPGTEATAPSVPAGSILDGDADVTVPIASVSFDGLATGEPKLLVPVLTPLATLGDSVSHGGEQPFAGGYLHRFGPLRVLQIKNMTLQASASRMVGVLPDKPTREVVGTISYGSAAGYVSVHTDGTVYCTSKSSGDFSGQVCFVA